MKNLVQGGRLALFGWLPGMSELLPAYGLALARTSMDAIKSVTFHFGDSGEWSNSTLRDAVCRTLEDLAHRRRVLRLKSRHQL